jgi:sn-glycerol 3-phosphate transport system substrate-binding protein
MHVKKLALALAAAALFAPAAQAQTEIHWWHSMTGANNTGVNELASRFNASQKEYKVVPVFKGSYPESMTAAIAAFRAGNPPHILQVFEVGTATMMWRRGRSSRWPRSCPMRRSSSIPRHICRR